MHNGRSFLVRLQHHSGILRSFLSRDKVRKWWLWWCIEIESLTWSSYGWLTLCCVTQVWNRRRTLHRMVLRCARHRWRILSHLLLQDGHTGKIVSSVLTVIIFIYWCIYCLLQCMQCFTAIYIVLQFLHRCKSVFKCKVVKWGKKVFYLRSKIHQWIDQIINN